MATSYGDAGVAERLRKARIVAGFASMRAASDANGWPTGTYSGHESGTRRILDDDLEEYAKGFRCPLEWLRSGEAPRVGRHARFGRISKTAIAELEHEFIANRRAVTNAPEAEVGHRLTLACAVNGFGSPHRTAAEIGLRRSALGNYAGGRNKLPPIMAAIYGIALRVEPNWIRTGDGPSGLTLPRGLDEDAALIAVAKGEQLALQPSPPDDAVCRIAAELDRAEARRLADRSTDDEHTIRMPEYRSVSATSPTPGEWHIPVSLVGHVPADRRGRLAIVTIDAILGIATRIQAGDRVIVEIGRRVGSDELPVALGSAPGTFVIADPHAAEHGVIGIVALHMGGAP